MNAFTEPIFAPSPLEQNNSFLLASPMMIHRAFDVRRVHNSNKELRMSMDVPGAQRENLVVQLRRRRPMDGNGIDTSTMNVEGTMNGQPFSKTVELPSAALDFANVEAKLTNGVLEIVAPKTQKGIPWSNQTTKIPVM